jgi:hypothetical protein
MRPFKFILFGLGCLFFAIFAKSLLEKHVPKEKVHVLERPMLIGTNADQPYYLLPAGVTLYWDADMPEGFSRYKVYFNVEGTRLTEKDQPIPGAITPATLQPIYKDDLIGLLKVMKLNTEDVKAIIAAAQFSDADRREIKELLSAP